MKHFILNYIGILIVGIFLVIICFLVFSASFAWFLSAAITIIWLIWCRPVMLLPVDLLIGCTTDNLIVQSTCYIRGEFFRSHYHAFVLLRDASGKKLWLVFPDVTYTEGNDAKTEKKSMKRY